MAINPKNLSNLLNTIEIAEKNLVQAKTQIFKIMSDSGLSQTIEKIQESKKNTYINNEESGALEVVEGYFNGEAFIGDNKQIYPVPPNYASKSQLIVGDRMKRILTKTRELFKLIQPANRETVTGVFAIAGNDFFAIVEGIEDPVRILKASATYAMKNLGLEPGGKISLIIPKDATATWGAFSSVVQEDVLANLREKSAQKEKISSLEDDILDFTGAIPDLKASNDYF